MIDSHLSCMTPTNIAGVTIVDPKSDFHPRITVFSASLMDGLILPPLLCYVRGLTILSVVCCLPTYARFAGSIYSLDTFPLTYPELR